MSYIPPQGSNFASMQGTDFLGQTVGATTQVDEPLNLGPNIFLAKPGDLPPEAFQSRTPTVQHLPDKIVKSRGQPIFPPSQAPSTLPNF